MREFSVKVMGNSMFPTIKAGESVPVLMRDDIKFCIGDILVFRYKNEGFLIHRLLQKKGQIYYCKGDNSIRMESVGKENILGVANVQNDFLRTHEFMQASLKIAELSNFYKENNIDSLRSSLEFRQYWESFLR